MRQRTGAFRCELIQVRRLDNRVPVAVELRAQIFGENPKDVWTVRTTVKDCRKRACGGAKQLAAIQRHRTVPFYAEPRLFTA